MQKERAAGGRPNREMAGGAASTVARWSEAETAWLPASCTHARAGHGGTSDDKDRAVHFSGHAAGAF